MNFGFRAWLTIASCSVLALIILTVSKKRLNIKYSIVWILWALFLIGMSLFPELFYVITDLIGIELPVNGVFLITIALLYALVFYVYVMISKHNEEIIKLTYEVSKLKREIDDLKKNEK